MILPKTRRLTLALLAALVLGPAAQAAPFVYQGALSDRGQPANGAFDLQLQVYASRSGADPVGTPITLPAVAVKNGVFKVDTDLATKGLAGDAYVAVAVRASGSGEAFVAIDGRAKLALAPTTVGVCWSTLGDAGSDSALNFLGTTDSQAFEIRTNNQRSLRLIPVLGQPQIGINVLAGAASNSIAAGANFATIAGGGFSGATSLPNQVASTGSTVSGGAGNIAGDPLQAPNLTTYATVGGGANNKANGGSATVAGGSGNTAANSSFVGGGYLNVASGLVSTIAGGGGNTASGGSVAIGGGENNVGAAYVSVIGGGNGNVVTGNAATIPGGVANIAGGVVSFAAGEAAIVRAAQNTAGVDPAYWSGDNNGDEGTFVWADQSSFQALVSTGPNQFLVRAKGGVGINTNQPTTSLDVINATNTTAAYVYNQLTAATSNGLTVRLGASTAGTGNNFLTFQKGSGAGIGAIEGNGAGGVQLNTTGADYGEYLPLADRHEDLAPGDVVGIRDGHIARSTEDADAIGVISTGAAVAGNSPGENREASHRIVAFVGQVEVTVEGPVDAGDLLIPSGRDDGRARAIAPSALDAASARRVIGRAWSSHDGDGVHRVRTFVTLGGLAEPALARAEAAERQAVSAAREVAVLQAQRAASDQQVADLRAEIEQLRHQQERLAALLEGGAAKAVATSR